jgi:hypothetical protein
MDAVSFLVAAACPFCASARAAAVRARIFDHEFALHVAGVTLPFLVLAAAATWAARRRPLATPS